MNVLLLVGIGGLLLLIAGRTYPYWIARLFREDDTNPTPAEAHADGRDYVKSPSQVVFAHHFASIAGAGPIIGPILAFIFGWMPAWLWIIVGGIFYGAVHDMTTMFVSVRESGKTIAEISRRTLGQAGFLIFIAFLILVLTLINAIFLNLSAAALTSLIPFEALELDRDTSVLRAVDYGGGEVAQIGGIATTSVFFITLCAPILGWLIYRRVIRGLAAFGIASVICLLSILIGFQFPIAMHAVAEWWFCEADPDLTGARAQNIWRILLAGYVLISCWIPVWMILQPRDFVNVQILYGGLILLLTGTIVAGFTGATISADTAFTIDVGAERLGAVWPFLFITIACGAISGFHSLVATGTTVKQIGRESDCRRIGYNAMLLESFLALLVLAAIASQFTHTDYLTHVWPEEGAGNPVLAFALACGNLFSGLGIPRDIGAVLGILVIEGFLVTTLDTAVRLCRYLFEELWNGIFKTRTPAILRWRSTNTFLAIAAMLVLAFSQYYGEIWPVFGSGNQLIGALALTTVLIWLLQRRRTVWFVAIPAVFMVVTTLSALWTKMWLDYQDDRPILAFAGAILFVLALAFVLVAAGRIWATLRELREQATRVGEDNP
ncbi:MAG: carbon starvation protein A [Phycisphaerales bacterium]|nr:MAG: carbon starvation protein A [Phycisphaerales bacterium]